MSKPDSDTRLKELLKDFAESLERTGGANPTWLARGPEGVSEARAAIESFFAQQEARIRELEALKLTPEEADHALTGWLSHGRSRHCLCVKLRRLSNPDTPK